MPNFVFIIAMCPHSHWYTGLIKIFELITLTEHSETFVLEFLHAFCGNEQSLLVKSEMLPVIRGSSSM